VAYPIDRARQFMTITSLSPSPNTTPTRPRYLTGSAPRFADSHPRRHLRRTKPGAPNTTSPRRSHPGRPKPAPGSSLNRRPCPEPANQIKQRRQIPHRPALASVRTLPAVSSLEAFRTPASVHLLAPGSGRHLKTLNEPPRSGARPGRSAIRRTGAIRQAPLMDPAGRGLVRELLDGGHNTAPGRRSVVVTGER